MIRRYAMTCNMPSSSVEAQSESAQWLDKWRMRLHFAQKSQKTFLNQHYVRNVDSSRFGNQHYVRNVDSADFFNQHYVRNVDSAHLMGQRYVRNVDFASFFDQHCVRNVDSKLFSVISGFGGVVSRIFRGSQWWGWCKIWQKNKRPEIHISGLFSNYLLTLPNTHMKTFVQR